MDEKVIPEFPTYAITSSGLIRDLRTGNLHNGHCHNGYRAINLINPAGCKHFLIHRLVGIAFIDNPSDYLEIDHINRNPADNRVENLRWVNDVLQAANKGFQKNNTSGYKNIIMEDNYYRVVIVRNKKIECRKRFSTLEEAIEYRNNEYIRLNISS